MRLAWHWCCEHSTRWKSFKHVKPKALQSWLYESLQGYLRPRKHKLEWQCCQANASFDHRSLHSRHGQAEAKHALATTPVGWSSAGGSCSADATPCPGEEKLRMNPSAAWLSSSSTSWNSCSPLRTAKKRHGASGPHKMELDTWKKVKNDSESFLRARPQGPRVPKPRSSRTAQGLFFRIPAINQNTKSKFVKTKPGKQLGPCPGWRTKAQPSCYHSCRAGPTHSRGT